MTIRISITILLVVAIAIVLVRNNNKQTSSTTFMQPQAVDKNTPDAAQSFGYKCMWFAIKTNKAKTDNTKAIAAILTIKNLSPCNWQLGIDKAYNGAVFISPSIDGWTLVCGWGLPHGDSKEGIEEVKKLCKALSKEFGEAQFFNTNRVVEYHCWIQAIKGHVKRVYAYLGESGENIMVEGEPTEAEKPLKLVNTLSEEAKDERYFQNKELLYPNEETLMLIAKHWSINPTELHNKKELSASLGYIGER